jgi:hypothetical protein
MAHCSSWLSLNVCIRRAPARTLCFRGASSRSPHESEPSHACTQRNRRHDQIAGAKIGRRPVRRRTVDRREAALSRSIDGESSAAISRDERSERRKGSCGNLRAGQTSSPAQSLNIVEREEAEPIERGTDGARHTIDAAQPELWRVDFAPLSQIPPSVAPRLA